MMRWVAVLAACLLCGLAPAAAETPRARVAIVPGVAVNLETARVDALTQDMADALSSVLEADVIGGLAVRRQLPVDLPADCVAQPTCATDVAQRLGASQLLFVVLVDTAGSVQVDSTWVEPATGKSVSRPAVDIAVLSESRAAFAASARTLLPDAPVRPKSKTVGVEGTMTKEIPRHFTPVSYTTAGLAVVGLGIGIGFGLRTKGLYEDCDRTGARCSDDDEDKIRTNALIADLGYVTALGGAIATAVLYATSGSESRLVVSPNVEGGGSVSYTGRF